MNNDESIITIFLLMLKNQYLQFLHKYSNKSMGTVDL